MASKLEMQQKYVLISELMVFIAALSIFGAQLLFQIVTDIDVHAATVREIAEGAVAPPANFLLYLLVYCVALFDTSLLALQNATVLVLAVAVVAKYRVTRFFAADFYHELIGHRVSGQGVDESAGAGSSPVESPQEWPIVFLGVLMLMLFSLPTGKSFYLGQFSPNVWHNSTTILVMPFSLLLFWQSSDQLSRPTTDRMLRIALLCVINVFAKPSYFLVFVIAYPLMLFKRFGLGRKTWLNLLPVGLGVIATSVVYYLVFVLSHGDLYGVESLVIIRPFQAWSLWSENIPLSLFCSLAFPISYLVAYREDMRNSVILQHAILSYLIALGIFVTFAEVGPRATHGNFVWQSIICSYLLFLVTAVLFLEKLRKFGLRRQRNRVVLFAFAAHVVSGFVYLGWVFFVSKSAW